MNIKILLSGKIKEPYFKLGIEEFRKRLFGVVEIVEFQNDDKMLEYVEKSATPYIVTMEIEGKMLSSVEFANKLREVEQEGCYNEILFLIGGSDGLCDALRSLSHLKFSMSRLTFLHQEAVLILIEQIYRAYRILNNEPYHK